MKCKFLFVIFMLMGIVGKAQMDEYGFSTHISINNLTIRKGNISSAKDAVSNALVNKNRSIGLSYFAKDGDFLYGVTFDISDFDDDYMVDDKFIISDNFYNLEQFVYKDLKENKDIENTDLGVMFLFGVNIVGNERTKLYFSNRLGMKNVSDRLSKVVLKESGSNNYYLANYRFKVSPLLVYNPSLELEYAPFDQQVSCFIYSGLYFQQYSCLTQVDIINSKDIEFNYPVSTERRYISLSTTIMTGIGLRVSIW